MGYEVFSRITPRVGSPAVTVSPSGRIGINQPAVRVMGLTQGSVVLLLWDHWKGAFAIQKADSDDGRGYRVGLSKNAAGISAKTFLDHIGYDYSETRHLAGHWNDKNGLLEIIIPHEHFSAVERRRRAMREQALAGAGSPEAPDAIQEVFSQAAGGSAGTTPTQKRSRPKPRTRR